jgi:prepilin-type processing-associated H-X9-DG protein
MKVPLLRPSQCRLSDAPRDAFTRWELLFVLATLAGLGAVTWPALAHTKPRADLVVCANNLRLVGRAEQMWASDHGDSFPWRVPISNGGSEGHRFSSRAWFHYYFMSNEIATASILVCPADPQKRPATDFSNTPPYGFLQLGDGAVSYFIGLDACLSITPAEGWSPISSALAGDRHVFVDQSYSSQLCSTRIYKSAGILGPPASSARWTNAVHGTVGNILFVDGQVSLTSTSRVAAAIAPTGNDNGMMHILPSR